MRGIREFGAGITLPPFGQRNPASPVIPYNHRVRPISGRPAALSPLSDGSIFFIGSGSMAVGSLLHSRTWPSRFLCRCSPARLRRSAFLVHESFAGRRPIPTDRSDSEFPAKCAGNSCQSCQSPVGWVAKRTQFPGFPFRENRLRRSPHRVGAAGGESGGVPVPPGG